VESWNFPDRKNTVTGHAINEYLAGKQDHNDRAIHLLFSANRWEKRQAAAATRIKTARHFLTSSLF
jgi:dTMP kinase